MSPVDPAPQRLPQLRPPRPRDLSDYEGAMGSENAWAAMNAARACHPRTHHYDAVDWFAGAVRRGIVFG